MRLLLRASSGLWSLHSRSSLTSPYPFFPCSKDRPPGILTVPLTHPPTHIRKLFLRKKLKFIKGARTWRLVLGTQTFFWAYDPRYSINQPLSKATKQRTAAEKPVGV